MQIQLLKYPTQADRTQYPEKMKKNIQTHSHNFHVFFTGIKGQIKPTFVALSVIILPQLVKLVRHFLFETKAPSMFL